MKPIIEIKSNSEDVRIYLDGVLHLRFPRDKDIKLQSWIDNHRKLYTIQIRTAGHTSVSEYDNRELWVKILELLDKHI